MAIIESTEPERILKKQLVKLIREAVYTKNINSAKLKKGVKEEIKQEV